MYKYLNKLWKNPKKGFGKELWKEKLIELRSQPTFVRLEKPTRLDRARELGYKAKKGFVIVRARVPTGGRKTPEPKGGRRPKRSGRFFTPGKSKQRTAEERAARYYPNLEVLNSYWVGADGKHKWYDIIMVDPDAPAIKSDKNLNWLVDHRKRVFHGLTSAGKKGRGLRA